MFKNKALIVAIFTAFTLSACTNTSQTSSPPTSVPTPQIVLKTWQDPAGFTFQYPETLTINNHPEDSENYAHLDVGDLRLLMQDNKFKTIDDWAVTQKGDAVDDILGGKPAVKVTLSDKVIVGAIDNEVLVTIESPPSAAQLFDQIVSSFEFVYPSPSPAKSSQTQPATDDNILEEE